MLKMNGGDEDKVCLIQKKIRERILIRRTHFDIGYDLYKQEKNAIRTFLLVDVFLDDVFFGCGLRTGQAMLSTHLASANDLVFAVAWIHVRACEAFTSLTFMHRSSHIVVIRDCKNCLGAGT